MWQGVFRRIYDTLLEDNIITVDQVSSFYHLCISYSSDSENELFQREQNGLLMRTDSVKTLMQFCV